MYDVQNRWRFHGRGAGFRSLAGGAVLLTALLASLGAQAAPEVGDPAPEFSLPGSDGSTYTLSALRGRWVVVAFFPKAFTGG